MAGTDRPVMACIKALYMDSLCSHHAEIQYLYLIHNVYNVIILPFHLFLLYLHFRALPHRLGIPVICSSALSMVIIRFFFRNKTDNTAFRRLSFLILSPPLIKMLYFAFHDWISIVAFFSDRTCVDHRLHRNPAFGNFLIVTIGPLSATGIKTTFLLWIHPPVSHLRSVLPRPDNPVTACHHLLNHIFQAFPLKETFYRFHKSFHMLDENRSRSIDHNFRNLFILDQLLQDIQLSNALKALSRELLFSKRNEFSFDFSSASCDQGSQHLFTFASFDRSICAVNFLHEVVLALRIEEPLFCTFFLITNCSLLSDAYFSPY